MAHTPAPVPPPVGYAPPVPPPGGYAPAPGYPPVARKRMSGGLIAAIVIVVCLALGVGLFFAFGRLPENVGPPASPAPPTTPTETATPTNRWAAGYEVAWSIQPGGGHAWVWLADQTADRLLLRVGEEDNDQLLMVDRATGKSPWSMQDDCTAPQIVGDEVWCSVEMEDTYETYRHDAASSELIDTIAIEGLDLPIPPGKATDRGFDGVRSMYGMPFAEFSTGELWDDHDMVLARLSDDFKSVLWQATFADGSEEYLPFSRRLHHGVLTRSVHYAIGADDGTPLPVCSDPNGCANIGADQIGRAHV